MLRNLENKYKQNVSHRTERQKTERMRERVRERARQIEQETKKQKKITEIDR